jgi:hypothetical protein
MATLTWSRILPSTLGEYKKVGAALLFRLASGGNI